MMAKIKQLGLFNLVMINITAVLSLNSISYMSTIGLQSIAFFVIAALMFFVPSALICAELGSMIHNDNGGIYSWVSRAFGQKVGLIAIWMEWFNNVIALPGNLSALVATTAYLGCPSLMHKPLDMFIVMLSIMWLVTLFNFLSISKIAVLNTIGALLGMIVPGATLIICGLYWVTHGHSQVHITHSNVSNVFLPSMTFATFALLVKCLSSYSGIQAVAFHARNIKRPARSIPVSMLLSVAIIFLVTSCATIALVSIVPINRINALNGLIEGITWVLYTMHLHKLSFIITLCVCIGMLSAMSTWVLSPARAIAEVSKKGLLPKFLAKTNEVGMPVNVLVVQAIFASVLALLFLVMPSIESAFAMLIALTAQFTVATFILVFLSSIRLRYKEPNEPRYFRLGGQNNWVLIVVATVGIIACGCGFVFGLFPPKFSHIIHPANYISLMLAADIFILVIPLVYLKFRC